MSFVGRNFILTINLASIEFYDEIKHYLTNLSQFQYFLCCEHVGQENRHFHIFVQYKNTKKLSVAKLHGAHIEKCFGSAKQNIDYVKANDKKHIELKVKSILIDEEGEPLFKGGNFNVGTVKEMDSPDELPAVLYNTYKKIKRDSTIVRVRDFRKNVKVYWIQGDSGVGKTNKAFEIAEEFEESLNCGTDMIKYVNGFYLGTTPTARVAIYDDFRDSHMTASEFINLIDYNKHWINIKGDSILNNYNVIILTSVQKFTRIYSRMDDEPRRQWERRVQVIDMYPPEKVCVGGMPVGYRTDFNQLEEVEVTDNWDGTHVVLN